MYLGYRTIQLWCCVSFFGSGGKYLVGKKKSSSHLSGRCAIVITTGKKKVLVFCLVGARSLLRPEKISSSLDFYAKLNVSNLNVTNLY
jgi:hypothetical protein